MASRRKRSKGPEIFNTSLTGHAPLAMATTKRLPAMPARSVSGVTGNRGQVNYSASKSGMIGMSKSIAKELATKGVTCNVVAPGFIKTDMTDVLIDQVKDIALGMIPLKRFGEANEIAACVSFLASPEAAYVTGQVICVDGGMVM